MVVAKGGLSINFISLEICGSSHRAVSIKYRLTPVESEAGVLGLVIPEPLDLVLARSGNLWSIS
jgi:hypothetical protein